MKLLAQKFTALIRMTTETMAKPKLVYRRRSTKGSSRQRSITTNNTNVTPETTNRR